MLGSGAAYAQMRAFDNSKEILPWIYNPAASFSDDVQAYAGYDGRGSNSFTPQSILAGIRMPLGRSNDPRHRGQSAIAGFQVLNTSQTLVNTLTVNLNFAQQIMINSNTKLAFGVGAGIYNMQYDQDALVYMDAQDPLLSTGDNLFNLHLNAGLSLDIANKLFFNVAAPYLVKNGGLNIKEMILRAGYIFPINEEYRLIPAVNLDTYNNNMIYGGDLRLEWRKTLSVMAGADRYKFHGGVMLNVSSFAFGYTYGQNISDELNNIQSHQLSIIAGFSDFKLGKGRR